MIPLIIKRSLSHAKRMAVKTVKGSSRAVKSAATKAKTRTSAASRAKRVNDVFERKMTRKSNKIKLEAKNTEYIKTVADGNAVKLKTKKLAKEAKSPYGKITAITAGGATVASALNSNNSEYPPYFVGGI